MTVASFVFLESFASTKPVILLCCFIAGLLKNQPHVGSAAVMHPNSFVYLSTI